MRRRQKNTLLPKMIGLAVLINAILLPILARFGAFKSIGGQRPSLIELVPLPPVPKPPPQPKKMVKKTTPKPHPERRTATRTAPARRAPPGPPPVKVVAVGPGASGSGGGGNAGITTSDSGPVGPSTPAPTPQPPIPTPPVTPTPTPPAPPPPAPTPPPPPPPAPHVPVLTAATPLTKPEPEIPDDLRDADLSANFEALFTVHPDGTAAVKVVSGTGNPTLDALALDAARRWTFRPATRDGQPVESYLRLRIEFSIDS